MKHSKCMMKYPGIHTGRSAVWAMMFFVVIATSFVVYMNTLGIGFVWDDLMIVERPCSLQDITRIAKFFTGSSDKGLAFEGTTPYYRPISLLSYAIDHQLWGKNPIGFHLSSVIVHMCVAGLVFMIAGRLFRSLPTAVFAGLLFAIHPIHAEAVAWVAARNELLAGLFACLAFLFYIYQRNFGGWQRWLLYGASLLTFGLGLLSKETAAIFPTLIFLYEWCFERRTLRECLVSTMSFMVLLVFYLVVRQSVLDMNLWPSPPIVVRLVTAPLVIVTYLRLLVWPFPGKVLYHTPIKWSFADPAVMASIGLLGVVATVVLWLLWKRNKIALPLGWILVAILPASGIVSFIEPSLLAERYLYIPSIGLCLLLAIGFNWIYRWCERQNWLAPKAVIVICLLTGVVCGTYTYSRNPIWGDEHSFYRRMMLEAPKHPLGYYLMGNWYGKQNNILEMNQLYAKSLQLTVAQQNNLAQKYLEIKRPDRARNEILRLLPSGGGNSETFHLLGLAYAWLGDRINAIYWLKLAKQKEPNSTAIDQDLRALLQGQ